MNIKSKKSGVRHRFQIENNHINRYRNLTVGAYSAREMRKNFIAFFYTGMQCNDVIVRRDFLRKQKFTIFMEQPANGKMEDYVRKMLQQEMIEDDR